MSVMNKKLQINFEMEQAQKVAIARFVQSRLFGIVVTCFDEAHFGLINYALINKQTLIVDRYNENELFVAQSKSIIINFKIK